eukprot:SAG31_NODE_368_length_16798_cov_20.422780_11_plen_103_part_00
MYAPRTPGLIEKAPPCRATLKQIRSRNLLAAAADESFSTVVSECEDEAEGEDDINSSFATVENLEVQELLPACTCQDQDMIVCFASNARMALSRKISRCRQI